MIENPNNNMDQQQTTEDVYVLPTSYAQQRLWFLDQFEPNSPFYNIPLAVRFKGQLDLAVLEKCINEIIERHETLRTTFQTIDEDPCQIIHPFVNRKIAIVNISRLPKEDREKEVFRLAQNEARTPFNLQSGPLFRIKIIHVGENDHVVLTNMHHIISDGWSMSVFVQEIVVLYNAFINNNPSPLPDLEIQYGDFAVWQQEYITGEVLDKQLAYWKNKLSGDLPLVELPADFPRPNVQTMVGANEISIVPLELTNAVKELAQREGVTFFMALTAVFQLLLGRYTGLEDICIGSPIANRNRAEIEPLIGLFVNTLVLRTDLSGNPTFQQLLKRIKQTTLDAYDNQDIPFEKLVDVLQPNRDMSHSPLFQVMFILQNNQNQTKVEIELPDVSLSSVDQDMGTSTFDLTLMVNEMPDGMELSAEYNTDIFKRETIQRLLGHYIALLKSAVSRPNSPISSLSFLQQQEINTIVNSWNDFDADYPLQKCTHNLFEEQVEKTPKAIAVKVGEQAIDYASLNHQSNQLARYLKKQNIGPDDKIAICLDKSIDLIVTVLAVFKSGGAYLPIDPTYPHDRIQHMLTDSQTSLVITESQYRNLLTDESIKVFWLDEEKEMISKLDDENLDERLDSDNLAYMIYTSGSTGKAKGTMISHRSLVNAYLAWEDKYGLKSRVKSHLQMASFSFDVFAGDFVRALCSGGKLVLVKREELLQADVLYSIMENEQVDCAEFVPAVLRNLVSYLEETSKNLHFVKNLIAGSDSWYVKEYNYFKKFCGPDTNLINSFGLSEAAIDSTFFVGNLDNAADEGLVPIGWPFPNTKIYILDRHLNVVPQGVAGELFVAGPNLARGYYDRQDLTAEKFIPNPFSAEPGARMYRTGDLARYLSDGNIEFLGRIDYQIKIRGHRIELGEIEAAMEKNPDVKQAVILAIDETPENKKLVAYITPSNQHAPDIENARDLLREQLPDYMLPSAIMVMDSFPLTPNGKIDRKALPKPGAADMTSLRPFVEPKTATEIKLAEIWSDVLGLEKIGVSDNFFQLGGHSLLATKVLSRIKSVLETEIPLRSLFEFATIAELAPVIDQAGLSQAEEPAITRMPQDATPELSFAQERLWFLDQMEPNSPFYNIPEAARIQGKFDVDVIRKSLNQIVNRHESLRTNFDEKDGKPILIVHSQIEVNFQFDDLSVLDKEDREDQAQKIADREAQTPFILKSGPLWRMRIVKMDETDHMLLMTTHHIISDDWSSQVLIGEIIVLYDAFTYNLTPMLPDLGIQYKDFAYWQRNWLKDEVLKSHINYWKESLAGCAPVLELPTDRPRPAMQTFNGSFENFELSKELSNKLTITAQNFGATPFMLLLSSFYVLLQRYSGQSDINIGTPIANRNRKEIEGLIGFFINTLVLRANLSDNPTFGDFIAQVKNTSLGAYAHQDLPFEKIVDAVQPVRDTSHSPLFQVMFVLQNTPGPVSTPQADLVVSPVESHVGISKFDLTLFMSEENDQYFGSFEYNTDLFDNETIERMSRHFANLLSAFVTNPELPVSAYPLTLPLERNSLVQRFNPAPVEKDITGPLHQLFVHQVDITPDARFITFMNQNFSYNEINAKANQLANYLIQSGAQPDSLVAVCLDRSPDLIISLLGILKTGAAYVPIDPSYPDERINYILNDSGATILISSGKYIERLSPTAKAVDMDSFWANENSGKFANPIVEIDADNLAYMIYTSGSTGNPKGSMITHGGLTNYLDWINRAYPVEKGRGSIFYASISFDATVTSVFSPILTGKGLDIVPEDENLESYLQNNKDATDYSLIKITPAHLALLGSQIGEEKASKLTHAFVVGGENLTAEQISYWQQNAPETLLFNEYGPTETVVGCVVYEAVKWQGHGSVPIGRPISNSSIYILDQNLEPVPTGVAGELYIAGEGVSRGYLNRSDLSADRFMPNPFRGTGNRMYKTGDLVRVLNNGELIFLDRIDNQVKVRGYRIELGEIEAALQEYNGIDSAAAIVREDTPGDKRLVAYYTESNGSLEIGSVRVYLKERMPEYMVPSIFVHLDDLPLTTNGKVNRKSLPKPEYSDIQKKSEFVAPLSDKEKQMAEIWKEVLQIDQVGINDNFFELGGDSILSIQVISRARQSGIFVSPKHIFQFPTIKQLVENSAESSAIDAEQGIVQGTFDLLPIQQWFFEQDLEDNNHYNQSILLDVKNDLNPDLLEQALLEIANQHDALRSTFYQRDDGWKQVIQHELKKSPLSVVDLSGVPAKDLKNEITSMAAKMQAGLDIENGPIFKVAYFDCSERTNRLLLVIHHLIVDGVSWRILMQDIVQVYMMLQAGQEISLPQKTSSVKLWSQKINEFARNESLLDQLSVWSEKAEQIVAIPTDHQNGLNNEASEKVVSVYIEKENVDKIVKNVMPRFHVQMEHVLLAALGRTLSNWTQNKTVAINLERHGREDIFKTVDLSRTIGWFTTIFPFFLNVPDENEFSKLVNTVKSQLTAVSKAGFEFGLLRYLNQDTTLEMSNISVPEISFNYLGRFDNIVQDNGDFSIRMSELDKGDDRAPGNKRSHVLDISASQVEGTLSVEWAFSKNIHREETITEIAQQFKINLLDLIKQAAEQKSVKLNSADFPLVSLPQETLDTIAFTFPYIEDIYPLSPMQSGMLFHTLYAPGSGVYVEQMHSPINGNVNIQAFKDAIQQVMERNAILRTSFYWEGLEAPVQIVNNQFKLPVELLDWQHLSASEKNKHIENLVNSEREDGFDLKNAPLLRFKFIKLGESQFHFLWTYHHILMDGWSMPILFNEIFTLYQANLENRIVELPENGQFKNYIEWIEAQDKNKAEFYWKNLLKNYSPPMLLPRLHKDTVAEATESDYNKLSLHLPSDLSDALKLIARESQVTINTVVQAAWAYLASSYTFADDILFGATVSGRSPEIKDAETTIGLFINTLPVRIKIDPKKTIAQWLQEIQTQTIESREFEFTPLAEIHTWSDVPRDADLFESILVFENYPIKEVLSEQKDVMEFSGMEDFEKTNYPLTVVAGIAEELGIEIAYDTTLFAKETIGRFLNDLKNILSIMAKDSRALVANISRFAENESKAVPEKTDWDDLLELNLQTVFEKQVEKSRDNIALIFNGQRLTYSQLNTQANQLAHYIQFLGIGPDDIVGLYLNRSIEMIVSILGVLKAGAAYLPIDSEFPADRVKYMIEDSGAKLVITEEIFKQNFADQNINVLDIFTEKQKISNQPIDNPCKITHPDNLAYVIYTSGSTGYPKGTLIPHKGAINLAKSYKSIFNIEQGTRVLQVSSLTFDASVLEIFTSLLNGATLVLMDKSTLLSHNKMLDLMKREKVNSALITPALLSVLDSTGLDDFQTVVTGGEACSNEVVEKWAPGRTFVNAYGPTEITVAVTNYKINRNDKLPLSIPIGKAFENMETYVLGPDMNPLPPNAVGELYVGGIGVGRGYLNKPDLTAEKFVPNPYSDLPGQRMYATGDLGRQLSDGNLVFIGRKDNQVKVRGYRIELDEIDSTLKRHADLADSAVILEKETVEDAKLVAFVVPKQPENFDIENLRIDLSSSLPPYFVPSQFVVLEKLPVNSSGKIDRKKLALLKVESVIDKSNFVAPETLDQIKLVKIWKKVLNVEQIGIKDNFFAFGGTSLLAIRLVDLVQQEFNVEVPLVHLFNDPTIERMAQIVEQEENDLGSPLVELRKGKSEETIFLVHPTGGSVHWYSDLAKKLDTNKAVYGLQAPNAEAIQEKHTSIGAMASYYVDAILSHQKEGPYIIGGWSFGVIVAFEIAQQLTALGNKIDHLLVLDQGPYMPITYSPKDDTELLLQIFSSHLELDEAFLRNMPFEDQLKYVLRGAKKARLFPPFLRLKHFKEYVFTNKTQTNAWRKYKHEIYNNNIILLKAIENEDNLEQPDDLRWSDVATGRVGVYNVPGDHMTMLQEPHVRQLAKVIEQALHQNLIEKRAQRS